MPWLEKEEEIVLEVVLCHQFPSDSRLGPRVGPWLWVSHLRGEASVGQVGTPPSGVSSIVRISLPPRPAQHLPSASGNLWRGSQGRHFPELSGPWLPSPTPFPPPFGLQHVAGFCPLAASLNLDTVLKQREDVSKEKVLFL